MRERAAAISAVFVTLSSCPRRDGVRVICIATLASDQHAGVEPQDAAAA